MLPISQEFHVPLTAVTAVFTLTLWMRLVGATAVWLARRSDRAQKTADDLDRLVFGVQLHRGILADVLVSVSVPRIVGHRHGRRMAVRRGIGDGKLADSARAVLWPACCKPRGASAPCLSSAAYGLLYTSIGWRGLLMIGVLPALWIVYIRKFVQEPPVWVENRRLQRTRAARSPRAAAQDLQARPARQHPDRVLVDGQRLCRRLFGRRAVPDLPAKGSASETRRLSPCRSCCRASCSSCRVRSMAGSRTASAAAGRSSSPRC